MPTIEKTIDQTRLTAPPGPESQRQAPTRRSRRRTRRASRAERGSLPAAASAGHPNQRAGRLDQADVEIQRAPTLDADVLDVVFEAVLVDLDVVAAFRQLNHHPRFAGRGARPLLAVNQDLGVARLHEQRECAEAPRLDLDLRLPRLRLLRLWRRLLLRRRLASTPPVPRCRLSLPSGLIRRRGARATVPRRWLL